jgi:hypothetical protein
VMAILALTSLLLLPIASAYGPRQVLAKGMAQ